MLKPSLTFTSPTLYRCVGKMYDRAAKLKILIWIRKKCFTFSNSYLCVYMLRLKSVQNINILFIPIISKFVEDKSKALKSSLGPVGVKSQVHRPFLRTN